jgi:hypothetical protein
MFALAKRVLQKYKTFVVKMVNDILGMQVPKTTMSCYVIVTLFWD